MPSAIPSNRAKKNRTPAVIALSIATFLLFAVIFAQATFKLTILDPDTSEQTLIFAALSALIFLLFVALVVVLIRTLLRLYAERKTGMLGSKFRSRMVMGALLLSLGPVIFLFMFSYGLMNRSVERWFSRPVEDVQYRTSTIAGLLTDYATANARAEAERLAATPSAQKSFQTGNFSFIMDEFRHSELTLQGGFAFALEEDRAEATFHSPDPWPLIRDRLPLDSGQVQAKTFDVGDTLYVVGQATIGHNGKILVAMPLPSNYSAMLRDIEKSQQQYEILRQQRRRLRRAYLGYLLFLTVGVLFASLWLALFLSRMVTRPLVALAEATHEISGGRLDVRVDIAADSEIGQLVQSFNKMAEDLESGRSKIEASRHELAVANVELEHRTRHIETVLESIPSGVLSVDSSRAITRMNGAMRRLLRQDGEDVPGQSLRDVFSEEVVADLEHMLRRADRMGSTTSQMEIPTAHANLNVAVTVATLDPPQRTPMMPRLGYVMVFEDMSDVLRAQKQAAWREVARRVAHEIKNPLTPIALSAERIRRHLERGVPPDAASLGIIRSCSETIGSSVETVRTLVDEFSLLARFPASRPEPTDVNAIIDGALSMFNGRLDGIRVTRYLGQDLPPVLADAASMKRAIANLVDNAAEAMQDSLVKEIQISTSVAGEGDTVEIVIADTGHGVTPELKEKLFLPYFSTKKRGTGLGLAIVSRIIEDHHGSIRVEENRPVGARFTLELPVQPEIVATAGESNANHTHSG